MEPKLLKQWLLNMRWKDWTPDRNSMICTAHFEDKHVDRTGIYVRLKPGAVPTVFSFPEHMKKKQFLINPKSRRALKPAPPAIQPKPPVLAQESTMKTIYVLVPLQPEPVMRSVVEPVAEPVIAPPVKKHKAYGKAKRSKLWKDSRKRKAAEKVPGPVEQVEPEPEPEPEPFTRPRDGDPWTIQGDAALMKLMTIPSFFHGLYCLPQSIHWAGDDDLNIKPHVEPGNSILDVPHVIEVTERWQWLGLDVRGPLPTTMHGHRFILTFTDYHSKWVEAFPLKSLFSLQVCHHLYEIIEQFGFPLGVLSRLSKALIVKMNRLLRSRWKLKCNSVVIHHRQTGYLDLVTESLLNTMVAELVREYPDSWHVHLPAAVLRLCCVEHPTTGERPFTRMLGKEPPPDNSPRELPFSATRIQMSSFVMQSTPEVPDSFW